MEESPYGKRVLAFDPGGTTGWAWHQIGTKHWTGDEIDPEKKGHHVELYQFLRDTAPQIVVCENFLFAVPSIVGPEGEKVNMPKVELISREYIGIIKLYCFAHRKQLIMQPPSIMATTWVKDEALQKLGLYTRGARHRNDATRHLFYYVAGTLELKEYFAPLRRPRDAGNPSPA
jgi:hypothetical protein